MAPVLSVLGPVAGLATGLEGTFNNNALQQQQSQAQQNAINAQNTAYSTIQSAEAPVNQASLTPLVPWGQQQGAIVQDYANQGINLGTNSGDQTAGAYGSNGSPIVQEALRRRNVGIQNQQLGINLQQAEQQQGQMVQQANQGVSLADQQSRDYMTTQDPLSLIFSAYRALTAPTPTPTAGIGAVPDPYATAQATGGFAGF